MSNSIEINKFMSYAPKTIGIDQSLAHARDVMRKLHMRHLPVLKGGKLVGILSDRDLNLVLTFKDVDPEKTTVEEALTVEPYFTHPQAQLGEVAETMAQKKYGCALVMDGENLVGIFTAIDAINALAELLQANKIEKK